MNNEATQLTTTQKLPDGILTGDQNRDQQILSLIFLTDGNPYTASLNNIISAYEGQQITKVQAYHYINSVLSDYYFNITMPLEDAEIRSQRQTTQLIDSNKDSIPNLTNVYEGKKYLGGRRRIELYKDVGWKAKKSGSNGANLQKKRLSQFMNVVDYPENKLLMIEEIYEQMIPNYDGRQNRQKIYTPFIEKILLDMLEHAENHILLTTKRKIGKHLQVLPSFYGKVPIDYYYDVLPLNTTQNYQSLKEISNTVHKITDDRIRHIFIDALSYLSDRKIIKISYYMVVVKRDENGKRISIPTIDDTTGELDKMILEAEQYTLSNIKGKIWDKKQNKYIEQVARSYSDVRKSQKENEYERIYNDYIQNNYDWLYTYEELRITRTDNKQAIATTYNDIQNQIKELNDMLHKAVIHSLETKYTNKENKYSNAINEYGDKKVYFPITNELISLREIWSQKDINEEVKRKYKRFPNPENFLKIAKFIIDTEFDINDSSEQRKKYFKWELEQEAKQQEKLRRIAKKLGS